MPILVNHHPNFQYFRPKFSILWHARSMNKLYEWPMAEKKALVYQAVQCQEIRSGHVSSLSPFVQRQFQEHCLHFEFLHLMIK